MDTVERGFRKDEHLRNSREIRLVMSTGRSASVLGLKILYRKNNLSLTRVAFVLKRKYGNAVERNYVKRLLRESYRLLKIEILTGFDIVFLAFPGVDTYPIRSNQVKTLIRNTGLKK